MSLGERIVEETDCTRVQSAFFVLDCAFICAIFVREKGERIITYIIYTT